MTSSLILYSSFICSSLSFYSLSNFDSSGFFYSTSKSSIGKTPPVFGGSICFESSS